MSGKSSKADDPVQYQRFLEAAKKAEAANSKEVADRIFKKVALSKNRKGAS
jgi:hypothetical protein